jgi:Peptidase family M50
MPPTPILDRLRPPPAAETRRTWKSFALGGVIGVVLLLLSQNVTPDIHSRLEFAISIFAAYYVAVLLHELGHLCATSFADFEFREIAVGPFLLSRRASGFKLRFVAGRLMAGGHVIGTPRSHDRLRERFRLVVSGGPIATGLLFVGLTFVPVTPFTWCLWLWNGILAASSWLPFYAAGSATDAKAILLLTRPGAQSEWFAAILYVMIIDRQGVPPRDWPADVVVKLKSDGASPPAATARYLAMVHALDVGERERIATALEETLAASHKLRPDLRRVCFSEAAFYQGTSARNAELARGWLEDARKIRYTTSEKGWEEGLLAAISVAEGKQEEVREHARAAIAYLDRWPAESGSVAAARRRLAAL